MEYPRHMTFAPGELEAEIRRIGAGSPDTSALIPEHQAPTVATLRSGIPRGKLLKAHSVSVTYPDGTEGGCLYERLGPAFHRFEYRYGDGGNMGRQYWTQPLMNCEETIEEAAKARAEDAFADAIAWERKARFCRVSEPTDGSRMKDPAKYQMSAKSAKDQAGKYAVCQRLGSGEKLLPASSLFDTIGEANEAWVQMGRPEYVVACCDRLDRCWDIPKYNPMPGTAREKERKEECHDVG